MLAEPPYSPSLSLSGSWILDTDTGWILDFMPSVVACGFYDATIQILHLFPELSTEYSVHRE